MCLLVRVWVSHMCSKHACWCLPVPSLAPHWAVVDHAEASKLCKERMAIAYGSPSAKRASAAADAKGALPAKAKRSASTAKRRQPAGSSDEEEGGEEHEGTEEEGRERPAGGRKPVKPRVKKAAPSSKGGASKRQRTLSEFNK